MPFPISGLSLVPDSRGQHSGFFLIAVTLELAENICESAVRSLDGQQMKFSFRTEPNPPRPEQPEVPPPGPEQPDPELPRPEMPPIGPDEPRLPPPDPDPNPFPDAPPLPSAPGWSMHPSIGPATIKALTLDSVCAIMLRN